MFKTPQEMMNELLVPLIEADGGSLELISITEHRVKLTLKGPSAFGPDSDLIRNQIIIPAFKKIMGDDVEVIFNDFTSLIPPRRK